MDCLYPCYISALDRLISAEPIVSCLWLDSTLLLDSHVAFSALTTSQLFFIYIFLCCSSFLSLPRYNGTSLAYMVLVRHYHFGLARLWVDVGYVSS